MSGENIEREEAFTLSKKTLYWAVVRAAAIAEPENYPGNVTAEQMVEALGGWRE